jgi:hypothetical protein
MKKIQVLLLVLIASLGLSSCELLRPKTKEVLFPMFVGATTESSRAINTASYEDSSTLFFIEYGPVFTRFETMELLEGEEPSVYALGQSVKVEITTEATFTNYRGIFSDSRGFFNVRLYNDLSFTSELEIVLLEIVPSYGDAIVYRHTLMEGVREQDNSYVATGTSFGYFHSPSAPASASFLKTRTEFKCNVPEERVAVRYQGVSGDVEDLLLVAPFETNYESCSELEHAETTINVPYGDAYGYSFEGIEGGGWGCYAASPEGAANAEQTWANF